MINFKQTREIYHVFVFLSMFNLSNTSTVSTCPYQSFTPSSLVNKRIHFSVQHYFHLTVAHFSYAMLCSRASCLLFSFCVYQSNRLLISFISYCLVSPPFHTKPPTTNHINADIRKTLGLPFKKKNISKSLVYSNSN